MDSYNSSSDQKPAPNSTEGARKILLVGDVSKAFLDVGNIAHQRYEFCSNMLDAIDAASKKDFAGIGVVMAGIPTKLSSSLRTLRDKSNAKIILLAQMYEEPIAMRLVGPAGNGTNAADDYLICPVQMDSFYKSFITTEKNNTRQINLSGPVDAAIEQKIKHLEKLATEDDLTSRKNRR